MPGVTTNSAAGLHTGLETVNQAVVYQYQHVFILEKLFLAAKSALSNTP